MPFTPTLEQEKIFTFFSDKHENGIIDAVAGSGKTSTLIEGIKYLPKDKKILFCAFNKKIQTEISQKVQKFSRPVIVKTTYALGLNILVMNDKKFAQSKVEEDKYYKILSRYLSKENLNDTKQNQIQEAFIKLKETFNKKKKTKIEDKFSNPEDFSSYKKDDVEELSFYEIADNNFKKLLSLSRLTLSYNRGKEGVGKVANFYGLDIDLNSDIELECYSKIISLVIKKGIDLAKENQVIDYADMIFLPDVFNYTSFNKYDIIFVDECQDLSNAQLKVVMKYHKNGGGRVFAVGDPFQSIYGFAGASPESFNNIKKLIKPDVFNLTNCFRCSQNIVSLAKEIREDISTTNTTEGCVHRIEYNNVLEIVKNKDFILSRFNKDIVLTFFKLISTGKSCKILGKEEILQEIIDFIPAKFHKRKDFYDELIGNVELIFSSYKKKFSDNETKITIFEGIRDVIIFSYHHVKNAITFTDLIDALRKLFSNENEDSIILSSIHKSKGLEAKNVFILNYDSLPFIPTKGKVQDWQIYKEKCLKYVAITRAEVNLFQVLPISKNEADINQIINKVQAQNTVENAVDLSEIDDLPL